MDQVAHITVVGLVVGINLVRIIILGMYDVDLVQIKNHRKSLVF